MNTISKRVWSRDEFDRLTLVEKERLLDSLSPEDFSKVLDEYRVAADADPSTIEKSEFQGMVAWHASRFMHLSQRQKESFRSQSKRLLAVADSHKSLES